MIKSKVIGKDYKNTADLPKGVDIYYHCRNCADKIPSVPDDNIGCECGNLFIDKDCWRLVIVNLAKIEVLRNSNE